MQVSRFASAFLLCAASALAAAAPLTIQLPPETAKLKPSRLPGYQVALQKCATCHSADYMLYQPPHMTLQQWTGEAAKMRDMFGAPLSDEDVQQVGAYLAVTYGSAKERDLPAELRQAARAKPAVAGAGGKAPDVKALLAANACLSCHAIDSKVVGPAYREIAKKYGNTASAIDNVAASIRSGSAGKWGQVAMPPFAQLKPEEARALAAFVLAR